MGPLPVNAAFPSLGGIPSTAHVMLFGVIVAQDSLHKTPKSHFQFRQLKSPVSIRIPWSAKPFRRCGCLRKPWPWWRQSTKLPPKG